MTQLTKVTNASVLALEPDLIFSSRIDAATRKMGISLTLVANVHALRGALTEGNPRLLLVNLDVLEGELDLLEQALTGKTCMSVGYYSHVNSRLAGEAKRSGLKVVVSRAEFVRGLPKMLFQALQ